MENMRIFESRHRILSLALLETSDLFIVNDDGYSEIVQWCVVKQKWDTDQKTKLSTFEGEIERTPGVQIIAQNRGKKGIKNLSRYLFMNFIQGSVVKVYA